MPRIRTIKPEMFDDPELGAVSLAARWLFVGLLTQADRCGRLVADIHRLKIRLMPFDEVNVADLLDELAAGHFVELYETPRKPSETSGNSRETPRKPYLQIRSFERHQRPHPKEPPSLIPDPKTVKRNGRPRKNTASKVDSGSLDSGSLENGGSALGVPTTLVARGRQEQEHRPAGRSRPLRTTDPTEAPKPTLLAAIAHEVLALHPGLGDADLKESVKARAAQLRVAYDAESVRKALDGVAAVRRQEAR